MSSADWSVRNDARKKLVAEQLRNSCDAQIIDSLIKAIPNMDAIKFLGLIGSPLAVDSLISTLEMVVNKDKKIWRIWA